MTHNLRHQDSLNSSGTISRKTSTASDYTPEHTLFQDSKVAQPNTNDNEQEFIVAEIDNSDPKVDLSDPELSSGRELSNTSISTISGDCTIRRDSQIIESDKNLSRQDTIDDISLNGLNSEPITVNVTGLTYAEVTKSPKKEFQSDEDYISVTSSQYTDTITSLSDVTSGHSSGSESKTPQKIELKICLIKNEKTELQSEISEVSIEKESLGSPQKDKSESETKLKVPQRKISRFLVSPVLEKLDLPKDKNYGGEIPENVEQDKIVQENTDKTETEVNPDLKVESEGPVCGPEMINTLEQLKISLQNITHAQLAQPATSQLPVNQKVQKPSVIGDSPQMYPTNDMLLTIDTSTVSNAPTPIITPTLQRQMSHSSTEPQLATPQTGFPDNYQFVQQPAVVLQNQATVQQPVVHQPATVQQQSTVLQQSTVNDFGVLQMVQKEDSGLKQEFGADGNAQPVFVPEQPVFVPEQPVETDIINDIPAEIVSDSSNQVITSPER